MSFRGSDKAQDGRKDGGEVPPFGPHLPRSALVTLHPIIASFCGLVIQFTQHRKPLLSLRSETRLQEGNESLLREF
jgi:hypothetical protein